MLILDAQDQSQVNTNDNDQNSAETITLLANGGYVITWYSGNFLPDNNQWFWADVHSQIYDAAGNRVGGEVVVNTNTDEDQAGASVVALADGGFIVLWQSTLYDPATIATQEYVVVSASIVAQRFDAAGNRVNLLGDPLGDTGNVVLAPSGWTPAVAQDPDGGFLMAWQTEVNGTIGFQLTYVDEEGDTTASLFHPVFHHDMTPQVVMLAESALLIYNAGAPGQATNIYGQIFTAAGAVGGPILINTYTPATQYVPQVVATDAGGFVTVWASSAQDGSSYGIYGQIFDASGARLGTEFRINSTTESSQNIPDIAAIDGGNFAVVWQSNGQDGSSWGVYLQIIDGAGNLIGGEIQIADDTIGSQSAAKVTSDGDTIFVTWSGVDAEGDFNIFTRQFSLSEVTGPTEGNDVLSGDVFANSINGLSGDDMIHGLGGDDTLIGGTGNDTLDGGEGDDVLDIGAGDAADGGAGTDRLVVNLSDVTVAVTAGADANGGYSVSWPGQNLLATRIEAATITTGIGNDNVNGTSGDDVISTGLGYDRVYAGSGADMVNIGNGGGVVWHAANQTAGLATEDFAEDTLIGGNGGDVIYVGLGDVADGGGQPPNVIDRVFVSFFGSETAVTLDLSTGDAFATLAAAAGGSYSNFEEIGVFGSVYADVMTGTAGSDRLFDLAPFDGAGGNDSVYGMDGNDYLSAGSGANLMDGGNGNDLLYNTSFESEILIGGAGNDTVFYGSSAPVDIIGNGADNVDGGTGIDALDYTKLITGLTVDLSVTTQQDTGFNQLTVTGVENIFGSAGNDVFTGNDEANALTGAAGDDVLDGAGGTGLDTLTAGAGNDTLIIRGGDLGFGDDGDDVIRVVEFNGGSIEVYGGAGYDTLDTSLANGGAQWVVGEGDDDIEAFVGGAFNDGFDASASTLTIQRSLSGGGGHDILKGGLGRDALNGGDGDDLLDGGGSLDTLTGGLGNDTFGVNSASDIVIELANGGTDTVETVVSLTLGAHVENLTLLGGSNLSGTGNALDNVLTGNSGNNILTGGLGNDTYYVHNTGDSVVEAHNEGTDTVYATVTYSLLGRAAENLILMGNADLTATGNGLANSLTGNGGNNILDGGAGNDTLIGGEGDDTFYVNAAGDLVVEADLQGSDTVVSSAAYVLAGAVEALILSGTAHIKGTGNALDNSLTGNDGNNVLDGSTGNDTLMGGLGNDTYLVDTAGDAISEEADGGVDTVQSNRTWTLGANLENLTLIGNNHVNAAGNDLNNVLTGNVGNNILAGGLGNDTYYVQNATDNVVEAHLQGTDSIYSTVTYSLLGRAVENLFLTGTANLNATGNGLANILTGNGGNNSLDGGDGNDTLSGGTGDDTYYVNAAGDKVMESSLQGNDTVISSITYTLAASVEALVLSGTANINGTGNGLDNVLTGNSGNNLLDGGTGNDAMSGGLGNDTYVVDAADDTIMEAAGAGTDTVLSNRTWTLGAQLENLTLTGNNHVNATGNELNNVLTGNVGNNVLSGGLGDDTYYVQNTNDNVAEAHLQGTDTIYSTVAYSLLGRAVENLILTGVTNINATGNGLSNALTGNSGINTLDGGAGADILTGGLGEDIFLFGAASGKDTITDFSGVQNDMININAYTGGVANAALVTQSGANTLITLGGGNVITVVNASQADVLAHLVW